MSRVTRVGRVNRGRVFKAVGLLAATLAVAACSSSSKSAGTGSTSSTSSATSTSTGPAASGAPIKVGMICTCSGAGGFGAFDVPAQQVYEAWIKNVNAAGGIDGHPVQLVFEDDGGNPGTAVSAAQTLVSDHVVAIADVSIVDQAFASAVQAAKIPVVGVEANNSEFGTNPDFYPEAQTNDSAIQAVITTAKAAGATNLANVYCAESPVCAQSVPYFASAGKAMGLPVTYNAEVSATAPNYTAQCLAAQQQHVTSMFIGDSSTVIARIAADCAKQGYNPIYITEGAGFGMSEASAPGLDNHLWTAFPAVPLFSADPVVAQVNAAIDKDFPGVRTSSIFDQIDFMAWASGILLEDALKAGGLTSGGTPTAAQAVQGLNSLKGDTLQGLTSPLTFTAGQPHKVDCWFTTRMQNGAPQMLDQGKPTCASGA